MTHVKFGRRTGRSIRRNSQAGFGMAIALAVLAVFALIAGAISLSNRAGNGKTDMETAKVMATSIVNRGNEMLQASQRLAQDRDLTKMVFAATAVAPAFGLYDPAIGVASNILVPGKAFTSGTDTAFVLNNSAYTIVGLGVNGTTVAAMAATLPGLTLQACQFINKVVFNTSVDALPSSTGTTALTASEGCLNVSAVYTYYKVLGSAV